MVRPLIVANPKITMEFDLGVQGWTESHMYTSVVPLSDAGLYNAMKDLVEARVKALDGRYCQLVAAKASLDDVNRDVIDLDQGDLPVPGSNGYANGPPPSPTNNWTYNGYMSAWPVKINTTNPQTNPLIYITIGSIPATQNGRRATDATGNTVATYIDRYMLVLLDGRFGALGRDYTAFGVSYVNDSIQYVPAAGAVPAQFIFKLKAPFPAGSAFPLGAFVALTNSTYNSPQKRLRLNGTYNVQAYNPTTGFLTVNAARVTVDPDFQGFGEVTAAGPAVYTYRSYTIRPLTHRKRGRPLDAARGRV